MSKRIGRNKFAFLIHVNAQIYIAKENIIYMPNCFSKFSRSSKNKYSEPLFFNNRQQKIICAIICAKIVKKCITRWNNFMNFRLYLCQLCIFATNRFANKYKSFVYGNSVFLQN